MSAVFVYCAGGYGEEIAEGGGPQLETEAQELKKHEEEWKRAGEATTMAESNQDEK